MFKGEMRFAFIFYDILFLQYSEVEGCMSWNEKKKMAEKVRIEGRFCRKELGRTEAKKLY